jgi:hypothetical protein
MAWAVIAVNQRLPSGTETSEKGVGALRERELDDRGAGGRPSRYGSGAQPQEHYPAGENDPPKGALGQRRRLRHHVSIAR